MLCINCFSRRSHVTNSRPHRLRPSVWRRRKCHNCGFSYTTQERLSLEDVLLIRGKNNDYPYSSGAIVAEIIKALTAVGAEPHKAYWLGQTVEDKLISSQRTGGTWQPITAAHLNQLIYETLLPYHRVAAEAFASIHGPFLRLRRFKKKPDAV